MSCFFPPIFKGGTYKKVRFFTISSLVLAVVLLFSACKTVRTVVGAPFKAVGWGANKVGEVVGGENTAGAVKGGSQGASGLSIDTSGPAFIENGAVEINFVPLIVWAIILVALALVVRALVNRHVAKNIPE